MEEAGGIFLSVEVNGWNLAELPRSYPNKWKGILAELDC